MSSNIEFEKFVDGETDYTGKLNDNFSKAKELVDEAVDGMNGMDSKKVDKPASSAEGILYQEKDGSTSVIATYPKEQYVYGVAIDLEDPNPAAVTYIDDARGFIPANGPFGYMGSWEQTALYKDIKPCVFSGTNVNYYIQKNNFMLKEEGINVSSVLNGNEGQVMIEFPKLYWSFEKSNDKKYLYVRIGNYKFSDSAVCYAHTDYNGEKDKLYVGAYKAYLQTGTGGTMGSIAGIAPAVSRTIADFRAGAKARGAGWSLVSFYSKQMTSILALLFYKTRDLQDALAKGWSYGNSNYQLTTGNLNEMPFCSGRWGEAGKDTGKAQMKFLGMEDYWGGIWEFCDGLVSVNGQLRATLDSRKYGTLGVDWEITHDPGYTEVIGGTYVKEVIGTNEFGFIPTAEGMGASEVTYWSDGYWWNNTTAATETTIALFGGAWNYAGRVGPFCWPLNNAPSFVNAYFGSRLMFL